MKKDKKIVRFGRSWGITIMILFAASLILAVNSIYMADRLFEMSLNQEYVRFISIQKERCIPEPAYNDGIFREDVNDAAADVMFFSEKELQAVHFPTYEEKMS